MGLWGRRAVAQVAFNGTRPELVELIRRLPAILSGSLPDVHGIARGFQLRLGVQALSLIQQDFLRMSRGGASSWGQTWPPLKPETIAYGRRATRGDLRSAGLPGKPPRPSLAGPQDARWRAIFARTIARLRLHMGEGAAEREAGKVAWAVLKAQGAKTKLELLGNRKVDIGRDTGRMFRAFSPGVDDRPSGEPEQVFETPPGRVIVGNNVPYFPRFHAKRPCWPPDGSVPDAWWPRLNEAAAGGLARAVELLARSGGP
jgi:hypothetical protein